MKLSLSQATLVGVSLCLGVAIKTGSTKEGSLPHRTPETHVQSALEKKSPAIVDPFTGEVPSMVAGAAPSIREKEALPIDPFPDARPVYGPAFSGDSELAARNVTQEGRNRSEASVSLSQFIQKHFWVVLLAMTLLGIGSTSFLSVQRISRRR